MTAPSYGYNMSGMGGATFAGGPTSVAIQGEEFLWQRPSTIKAGLPSSWYTNPSYALLTGAGVLVLLGVGFYALRDSTRTRRRAR